MDLPLPLPRLAHAIIVVPDLDAAQGLYCDQLEQQLLETTRVSETEAGAWDAPALVDARCATLCPPVTSERHPRVVLRLIEQKHWPANYRPGCHHGWAALELSVQSADRLHERLVSHGVPIIAPPKPLSFTNNLYPMQARGPGGEALYLNEVRGDLPDSDLPRAGCWVDRLFIAVLACADVGRSELFYQQLLAIENKGDWLIPYQTINSAFALPIDTRHAIKALGHGREVMLELDQYPTAARPLIKPPGGLPFGVAVLGFEVGRLPSEWSKGVQKRLVAPYQGRSVAVVKGPDGELTELVLALDS
jgi:catechol 2,3-dioxygenase-like lactoylglutathione lyase family enzyme